MAGAHKRHARDAGGGADKKAKVCADKKAKTKKQWRVPRPGDAKVGIQPGDSGIWVSCGKGREGQCVREVADLFGEWGECLYAHARGAEDEDEGGAPADAAGDIESEVRAEVRGLRRPSTPPLFTPVMLQVPCVVFFKTRPPVEPVSFVKAICEAASEDRRRKRTRFAKRLSPMTLVGRASADGLAQVAAQVLKAHFHQEPFQKRKFAIRPNIRNNTVFTRNTVIQQVASVVGPGHEVDLTNYELLIVVEVYQNICGVGVLDNSFERLKRYNLSEIFDPTPQEGGIEDVK